MARKGRREGENKRVSSSSFPWSLAPGQQSLAFRAVPRSAWGGALPELWSFRSDGLFSLFSWKCKKTNESLPVNHKPIGEFVFFQPPLYLAPLHMPLNPSRNFRCVRMRGRAFSVPETGSVFPTGFAASGLKIFRYEHFSSVTSMNYSDLDCIVYHCRLYFALLLSFSNFAPELVSRIFALFFILESGLKFLIWTQGKIGPCKGQRLFAIIWITFCCIHKWTRH